ARRRAVDRVACFPDRRGPLRVFLALCCFHRQATTAISPLSLHDALPISDLGKHSLVPIDAGAGSPALPAAGRPGSIPKPCQRCRSEEHTSELQSQSNLVCRLLLEKKNTQQVSDYILDRSPLPLDIKLLTA